MTTLLGWMSLATTLFLVASSCGMFEAPPPPLQAVLVRVNADPGTPVPGADIFFN